MLLSSHLLGEVEQVCDRVGVIVGGRLRAEGTVADLRGRPTVVLRVDPMARAVPVVAGLVGAANVSTVDGALELSVEPERTPDLVRALVSVGIDVQEVRPRDRTLEDVFFALTGEPVREESAR